jgi:protein-tyrosine phosphatase
MEKRSEKTVLFLCTGNFYRSRFAEVMFKSVADKMGLPRQASSRRQALEQGVNNVGTTTMEVAQDLEVLGVRATEAELKKV